MNSILVIRLTYGLLLSPSESEQLLEVTSASSGVFSSAESILLQPTTCLGIQLDVSVYSFSFRITITIFKFSYNGASMIQPPKIVSYHKTDVSSPSMEMVFQSHINMLTL